MNHGLKIFLFCFLLVTSSVVETSAQNKTIDSLKLTLKNLPITEKQDSTRCKILAAMVEAELDDRLWPVYNNQLFELAERNLKNKNLTSTETRFFQKQMAGALNNKGFEAKLLGDLKKAMDLYNQSLTIQEVIADKEGIAATFINIGSIYNEQGNASKALDYYTKSLKINEERKDKKGIAAALFEIGFISHNQGDIPKALDCYSKCLKLKEELGDQDGIAYCLNNMAYEFSTQGDVAKAEEYYKKGLKIREQIGDKEGIAVSLSNIGLIYHNRGEIPKALEYYTESLKILEELGNKKGACQTLQNIGGVYHQTANYSKAMEYYNKCLQMQHELGDKPGTAYTLRNIGHLYYMQKSFAKSIDYLDQSMKLCKELNYPEYIGELAYFLNLTYKASGNYKLALTNFEIYIQMQDSINNETTRKASIRTQLKYEYEKQAAADSVAHAKESEIKNVQLAKQKVEITAKKNQQYALFGGLALVMIFAGFMFNRFKVTKKQKVIIELQKNVVEQQKHLVEEKQKEVLDSIHYAKRIQTALIPSEKFIDRAISRLQKRQ